MVAASDIGGLNPVIKREENTGRPRAGEYFISIREGSGEIDAPIWHLFAGQTFTYRVFTDRAGEPAGVSKSSTVHVKDPESGDLVNLAIHYWVICPDGNQHQLVKSLGRNGDPDGALRALITAHARTFLWEAEKDFFSDLDGTKQALIARITEEVKSQTGLRFRGEVHLELEDKLNPLHIDEYFEVHFSDSQEPKAVRIQADLDIIPTYALRAIVAIRRLDALKLRVIEATKLFSRQNIPAQAFAQQFRVGDYVEKLSDALLPLVAKDGRSISGLTLTAKGHQLLPPAEIELILPQNVTAISRNSPITLTTKLLLSLENLADYQKSQTIDVKKWAEAAFEAVVRVACFEKTYLDYLRTERWRLIEDHIKQLMEAKAQDIGYLVRQIFLHRSSKKMNFGKPRHTDLK